MRILRTGFNRALRFISEANQRQKIAMAVAVAMAVLMLLFPPYEHEVRREWSSTTVTGYGFLFDMQWDETIRVGRLITQWMAVAVIACLAYFVFRNTKQ